MKRISENNAPRSRGGMNQLEESTLASTTNETVRELDENTAYIYDHYSFSKKSVKAQQLAVCKYKDKVSHIAFFSSEHL